MSDIFCQESNSESDGEVIFIEIELSGKMIFLYYFVEFWGMAFDDVFRK